MLLSQPYNVFLTLLDYSVSEVCKRLIVNQLAVMFFVLNFFVSVYIQCWKEDHNVKA